MASYSCKNIFLYDLPFSYNTLVTNGQTNDNRTISSSIT